MTVLVNRNNLSQCYKTSDRAAEIIAELIYMHDDIMKCENMSLNEKTIIFRCLLVEALAGLGSEIHEKR